MAIDKEANLRAEYAEIGSNFRTLTDIRFRLLTILPFGTILAAWFATAGETVVNPFLSLFGLVITLALMIYNERNDQHYGELAGRAAELERRLNLPGGQFNQRPAVWFTPVDRPLKVSVTHGQAIGWIYKSSLVVWLIGVLYPIAVWLLGDVDWILGAANWLSLPPQTLLLVITAVAAFIIIWITASIVGRRMENRKKQMRAAAFRALDALKKCAVPPATADQKAWLQAFNMLAVVQTGDNELKTLNKMLKRANYYVPEWPARLGSTGDNDLENKALLAAALCGQSARWLLDTYTGRSGTITNWDGPPQKLETPAGWDKFFLGSDMSPASKARAANVLAAAVNADTTSEPGDV